jgi:hypothetical protein
MKMPLVIVLGFDHLKQYRYIIETLILPMLYRNRLFSLINKRRLRLYRQIFALNR